MKRSEDVLYGYAVGYVGLKMVVHIRRPRCKRRQPFQSCHSSISGNILEGLYQTGTTDMERA